MKTGFLSIALLALTCLSAFLFFRQLDSALEVDSLKEQVRMQRREASILENVLNENFAPCAIKVAGFEQAMQKHGRTVLWQGDVAQVGIYKVVKKEGCIVAVNTVDGA
ncbi:hypothetical protein GCM10027277_38000 [Pseudoduganella ginsengisoli]|uniref:Uncharacterized protein n=1 Tax=Pseudoduganella ginsengisoli TaxID=1462440 RepID=A0A6L6Q8K3_9BURK|nr:hypothetical protein [Pseudoduganella ginsengisoli]MTW05970.1 hypothetical protein [Pseudoduganella ginsengisoli]